MTRSPRPRAFDVLLRAVAIARSELELADLRVLASTHHQLMLDVFDQALVKRQHELRSGKEGGG